MTAKSIPTDAIVFKRKTALKLPKSKLMKPVIMKNTIKIRNGADEDLIFFDLEIFFITKKKETNITNISLKYFT